MKNPFDDDPLYHNKSFDILGNHPQHAAPDTPDGFQSHHPDFQDNSPLRDFHHDPLYSEWSANHPEHPNAPDPLEWNAGHQEHQESLHPTGWDPGHYDPQGHLEHQAHPHQPEMPNLNHSDWTDGTNVHPLGDSGHPLQTELTNPLPDAHPHSHDSNWTPQYEHHTFGSAANSSVLRFESSSDSNTHPYITVSDSLTGHVYLNGDKDIGHIDGHAVYNSDNHQCGYWKTDGKVYDYHDNLVGWVHPDGHVYVKGSSGDLEVYQTEKGVAGGAAYLLLVWCGGQTHV